MKKLLSLLFVICYGYICIFEYDNDSMGNNKNSNRCN